MHGASGRRARPPRGPSRVLLVPCVALVFLLFVWWRPVHSDVSSEKVAFERYSFSAPLPGAPWITVAIPTYHRAATLKKILPSYLASPAVGKIVISDDFGSNDTAELRVWLAEAGVPASAVELIDAAPAKLGAMRNKIRAARAAAHWSAWIALLDSDNTATHEEYFEPLRAAWIAAGYSVPPSDPIAERRIFAASRYYVPKQVPWACRALFGGLGAWLWPHSLCALPAPHVADFSFLEAEGHAVTRANFNRIYPHKAAGGLLNDANNVFHRRLLDVWEPLAAADVADPPGIDALFLYRNAIFNGFSLVVVPGMAYTHPASDDSFYMKHDGKVIDAYIAKHSLSHMEPV